MFQSCTLILCGSLGQEGSGNYCLLQNLQKEGYGLLLKPVSTLTELQQMDSKEIKTPKERYPVLHPNNIYTKKKKKAF